MKVHRPNTLVTSGVVFHLYFPSASRGNDKRAASKRKKDLEQAQLELVSSILLCFVLTSYFKNLLPNTLLTQPKSPLCTIQYISDAQ